MISIKKGVRICGISPEMMLAHTIVSSVFEKYGADTTVTSALDGQHSRASKHYSGQALDYRTYHINSKLELNKIAKEIGSALGQDFDCCLESDHIHVEFDPKVAQ